MVKDLYSKYEKGYNYKKTYRNFLDYISLVLFLLGLATTMSIFIYLTAGNYTENGSIIFFAYLLGLLGGIAVHFLFNFENVFAGLIISLFGLILTFIISFFFSIYPYYVVFKGSLLSLLRLYIKNNFYLRSLSHCIFIYSLLFNSGYYVFIIIRK